MPPSPSTSKISKRPPSTSPGCSLFCFGKTFESRGWPAAGVGDGSTNVRSPAAAFESIGGVDGPSTNVAPSSSRGTSLAELSPLAGARTAACPPTPILSGLAFLGLGSSIQSLDADLAHHYLPHPWERMLPSSSEKYIPIRTLGDIFVLMAPRPALLRQSKGKQRRPGGYRNILLPVHGKRHRRRIYGRPALKVPQRPTSSGVERDNVSFGIARKHQPACCRQHPGPSRRGMLPFPLYFSRRRIERAQCAPKRLRFIVRKIGGAVVRVSRFIRLRRRRKNVALLACRHIKKFRLRIVGRRHPVRRKTHYDSPARSVFGSLRQSSPGSASHRNHVRRAA